MEHKIFAQLQGESIRVLALNLEGDSQKPILLLRITHMETVYVLRCNNVSDIHIQTLSVPFDISGFEIRDNKSRGWEKQSRYSVLDFEDDRLRFCCEEIELL